MSQFKKAQNRKKFCEKILVMVFNKDFGAKKEDRLWKLLLLNFVRSSSTLKTHFYGIVPFFHRRRFLSSIWFLLLAEVLNCVL
jgi:hypothetical protein